MIPSQASASSCSRAGCPYTAQRYLDAIKAAAAAGAAVIIVDT